MVLANMPMFGFLSCHSLGLTLRVSGNTQTHTRDVGRSPEVVWPTKAAHI